MIGPGFEGSYLGAGAKISPAAVMECKICWTPYDPEEGDETRQIPPGTPFLALPQDWKCPVCDGAREQFMVLSDEGTDHAPVMSMDEAVANLTAEFREIYNAKMRDVPFCNKALHVQPVGFRAWEGRFLGVLVTPWFMNLTMLPGPGDDWSGLVTGDTEIIDFPSGPYEFIHTCRNQVGGYKSCSLFSPMGDFTSQLQATDVAAAVMHALFDAGNREESSQAGSPADAALDPDPMVDHSPSRRALIGAGFGRQRDEPRP